MSGKSVSRGKMLIFRAFFLISLLMQCLCGESTVPLYYNREDCGHNREGDLCVIESLFGYALNNDTVDVFVNCSNHDEIFSNQLSNIEKIVWNGCEATRDLKGFGLKKIPRKNQVKYLKIEKFAKGSVESGTFDGFLGLEILSIQRNRIENLSSSCFRGLESLKLLDMIENKLKRMDAGVLGDMPQLKSLQIYDSESLLIANHQFAETQAVDNVDAKIYYIEMDLLEHLLVHVRNLSITVKMDSGAYGCDQIRLNGYEKDWIIEKLKLDNLRCGFTMENCGSIKSLQLNRAVRMAYSNFRLKDLPKLQTIELHENVFDDTRSFKLEGILESLQLIDISENSFQEIDMREFEPYTKLKRINLSGNFLKKLDELFPVKFENVELLVDQNKFDCSWLNAIASSKLSSNFVFKKNFTNLNFDGLSCQYYDQNNENLLPNETFSSHFMYENFGNNDARRELLKLKEDNFLLKPEVLIIIVCTSALLGMALTFISIYVHRQRQILEQKPFYHLLRDSIVRPISDVRSTLKRDFKEIISRNLPPTNYEHPISDLVVTEMSDVAANTANIYEEIPQKVYQEIV